MQNEERPEANQQTAGQAVGGGGQSGAESGVAGAGGRDGPHPPTWAEAEAQDWQALPRAGPWGRESSGKALASQGPGGVGQGSESRRFREAK